MAPLNAACQEVGREMVSANLRDKFFQATGGATPLLRNFLDALEIPCGPAESPSQILEKIESARGKSDRPLDRPEMVLNAALRLRTEHIIEAAEKLLDVHCPVVPAYHSWEGVLYLGSSFSGLVNRLQFYNKLVEQGHVPGNLKMYVLTGDRKASAELFGESPQAFLEFARQYSGSPSLPLESLGKLPETELDMIKFVFKYIPPKSASVTYIYSQTDPSHKRATTDSTMITFLKEIPSGGRFLAVSNQPYVDYQQSVLELRIAKQHRSDVRVSTVGDTGELVQERKDADNYGAVMLDTVAKTLKNVIELRNLETA